MKSYMMKSFKYFNLIPQRCLSGLKNKHRMVLLINYKKQLFRQLLRGNRSKTKQKKNA